MLKIGGGAVIVAAIIAVFVVATQGRDPDLEALEHEGREYILQLDKAMGLRKKRSALAEWAYASNITKENEEKLVSPMILYFIFSVNKKRTQKYRSIKLYANLNSIRRVFCRQTSVENNQYSGR